VTHTKTTGKAVIQEQVIKGLLSALKSAAEVDDVSGAIEVSKYLLQLADKFGDVSIAIGAEEDSKTETFESSIKISGDCTADGIRKTINAAWNDPAS